MKECYLSPKKFADGHNEKKIIAQAMVIALFGKAFKGCLQSSNTTLEIFSNILENLNEMYQIVFVNLHEYIDTQDQKEYDRLSDGGVNVLQELFEQRNCINIDHFDLLKETLKTMRQQAQEMREHRRQQQIVGEVIQPEITQPQQVVVEKVEDLVAPEVLQPQPEQIGSHNTQKKTQRLLLLLLFGGGTMAGIYYLAKHYNPLKNWLSRFKMPTLPFSF